MDGRPKLPEGWTWADKLDPCGGFVCPHGNYFEVDGEFSGDCTCRNPAFEMGWL